MKNFSRFGAILLYIFIMSYLLDFRLLPLFDLKQAALVLIGMIILFLPGFKRGEGRRAYAGQLARCAIFASYIQTFIMLFIVLSNKITLNELPREAALSCRPLLYGICLWVILSNESEDKKENAAENYKEELNENKSESISKTESADIPDIMKSDTDIYHKFRELGLTNREAELALKMCKGLTNSEIAYELNISETTVKKHASNIFEKLKINRREQLLQFITKY